MNWKEFLKPTRNKIILFIALAFLSISFFIFAKLMSVRIYSGFYYPFASEMGITSKTPKIITRELLIVWVIQIIFILIYDYFLSCLIIWIYDKVKKK